SARALRRGRCLTICGAPMEVEMVALLRDAEFWNKVRGAARRVPFLDEAVAAWYAARDPRTPAKVKITLIGALAYFVLPVDFIPDFVTALGFTDDAAVLFAAVRAVTPHVREEHRAKARAALRR